MEVRITSAAELGEVIRSVRKTAGIRIDDVAYISGVSKQFASDVEHGKPTVEFDRVLLLLKELGIELQVNITEEEMQALLELRAKGGITTGKDRWPPIVGRSAATFELVPPSDTSMSVPEGSVAPHKTRSGNE